MKTILIALNVIFIAIIIFLLFKQKEKTVAGTTNSNLSSSCVECKDYSNDLFTGIKLETAREMANLYRTNHYDLYNNAKGVTDARSIWFSLDTLKKFIWTIEKNACSQQCGSQLNLGVRMYYAEYPADLASGAAAARNPDYSPVKRNYAGMHTLFMVPTYYADGSDWDFNPLSGFDAGCKPQRLTEYLQGGDIVLETKNNLRDTGFLKQPAVILFAGPGSNGNNNLNGAAQNHGNMIPPDNATGTAF